MKRFVTVSLVIMVLLSAAISRRRVQAAYYKCDASVKNGRLFEVRVSHMMCALGSGIFTLEYDSADINYRDITSENGEVEHMTAAEKQHSCFSV